MRAFVTSQLKRESLLGAKSYLLTFWVVFLGFDGASRFFEWLWRCFHTYLCKTMGTQVASLIFLSAPRQRSFDHLSLRGRGGRRDQEGCSQHFLKLNDPCEVEIRVCYPCFYRVFYQCLRGFRGQPWRCRKEEEEEK